MADDTSAGQAAGKRPRQPRGKGRGKGASEVTPQATDTAADTAADTTATARSTGRRGKGRERTLTDELAALLARELVPDLTARARQPAVARALAARHAEEREKRRTAAGLEEWVAHRVEQVGAAWILSCVFVRVLEDRGLIDRRRIAGPGAEDAQHLFFEIAPSLTERDYLLTVFRELAGFPGMEDVFGPRPSQNPAWQLSPSNDIVRALLALLRQTGADGGLRFRFEGTDTRFLGDLYQDLSESVRERYALLQTPAFVERFILDQTLEPAIATFGLGTVRIIDPTCGSGHFVLGAFERLCEHRMRTAPGRDRREHARDALAQVYGVDVNPYAVAIARFRLTLAYLQVAGFDKLTRAPRIETAPVEPAAPRRVRSSPQLALPVVVPEPAAPAVAAAARDEAAPRPASHWAALLRASEDYREAGKSKREYWDEQLVPAVDLLAEHLNLEQHPVLVHDARAGQVRLDLELLKQLFGG